MPLVNASLDEATNEIAFHDHYHLGVAVSTPGGLIVPVIRDADQRDLGGVAREIERLSNDARAGKQRLDDLRGGTFSVTSVGNIGGLISTPIINHPEVGILGVGRVVKRPVFDANGQVRPADMVYLSFSFDHRVVDGAVGAAFANAVIERLRNPVLLLLRKNCEQIPANPLRLSQSSRWAIAVPIYPEFNGKCAMLSRAGFRGLIPSQPRETVILKRLHAFAGLGRRDDFDGSPRKHGTPVGKTQGGVPGSRIQNREAHPSANLLLHD